MACTTPTTTTPTILKEIVTELGTLIRYYNDGTLERPVQTPFVPPLLDDPQSGVSSKDILISHNPKISARIYLPKITNSAKFPIYVYFHGGGFFFESAFSKLYNTHLTKLVTHAKVIAVSVEYRLAPEHPLPACYHDCWDALQWVASHSTNKFTNNTEPWLINHADFNRVFIGGDSAGGNIVHNIAMRAGAEDLPGGVKVLGALLMHPFFFSSQPIGSESAEGHQKHVGHDVWNFVYPSAPGGVDNPLINVLANGAPSLTTIGCSKILVFVAGKDQLGLRDRGVWYYEAVKKSEWQGEIELWEDKEEGHVYYLFNSESETAYQIIKRMASFLLE